MLIFCFVWIILLTILLYANIYYYGKLERRVLTLEAKLSMLSIPVSVDEASLSLNNISDK